MPLTITNIPGIMRANGWRNGAILMETWFRRHAAAKPTYGPPEVNTIKMDGWVLTFPRAKAVYDSLLKDRIWANPAAQRELTNQLRGKGLLGGRGAVSFGPPSGTMDALDRHYINFRTVSTGMNLDDLSAALGMFAFRVVVGGSVVPRTVNSLTRHEVTISDVGIYVRDSYDFEGSQHLGYWDDSDNSVSMANFFSGTAVSNEDFRDWRAKNRMGGDFVVFSDTKWTALAKADSFVV